MTVKHSKEYLDRRWIERKAILTNIVRKNIFSFPIFHSFLGFIYLRFSLDPLGIKFPTKAYFWCLGVYLALAVVVYSVVFSEKHQSSNSKKLKYLTLMAWHDLFFFILESFFIGLGFSTWLLISQNNISIVKFFSIFMVTIIILGLWAFRRITTKINSNSEYNPWSLKLLPKQYYLIIGLLTLITNVLLYIFTTDIRLTLLLFVSFVGGVSGIYGTIEQSICDYIYLKNDFLN